MRKLLTLAAVGALLLLPALAQAQGISTSKHDFSGAGWNGTGEICRPCHTPHNSAAAVVPLWNRATPAGPWTMYSSTSMEANPSTVGDISQACLSCHDNSLGLDAFDGDPGNLANNIGTLYAGSTANLGTDLSNDHPITIDYNAAAATDTGIRATMTAALPLFTSGAVSNSVECATCHNVHTPGASGYFLRMENAASQLCLNCHNK